MNLKNHIAEVPDFPIPGISFKDVTTILSNPDAFRYVMDQFKKVVQESGADVIAGIESRGFLFGMPLARDLGLPFVPIRKPGKLPRKTISESYQLEYGTDSIEVHCEDIKPYQRVVIIDDLLATGGTMNAACSLIERLGAKVSVCLLVVDLPFLGGRKKLAPRKVVTLVEYDLE